MAMRLTEFSISVWNEDQKSVLLEYLPEIRSNILLLLSKQSIDNLNSESGKLQLKKLVKEELSRGYDTNQPIEINEVLFTDFIIR